ncbi:MAG TPA: hypothetical protein VF168_05055 [Trueperaceae bacterium]
MTRVGIDAWIRAGLLALPVYGLLTMWSTWDAQPDQVADPEAWAQYVSSTGYVVDHALGAIGGAVLAILGVFALGCFLSGSRAGRLGLGAMVATVAGHALGLAIGGVSAFATPAVGRAYLAGITEVMRIEFPTGMIVVFALAVLLMFVGNVLLGWAVWRSGILPKWAGATWALSAVLFYVLGAVLGAATTGGSLPTQPLGAALMVVSGAWIAWSAGRRSVHATLGASAPHV